MRVLVIIPAYNEERTVVPIVDMLHTQYPQYDYVVINDGSNDSTRRICAQNHVNTVNLPVNLGIGAAMQTGYLYAKEHGYDIAVQLDGDGQHDVKDIPLLVKPIVEGTADYVIGSRFVKQQGDQTSAMRRLGIRLLRISLFLTTGSRLLDVTSGFRACTKPIIELFSRNYAQDYPEPEAIGLALNSGFKTVEVPVNMRKRQHGASSITPFRSGLYMLKVSLAILIKHTKIYHIFLRKRGEDV